MIKHTCGKRRGAMAVGAIVHGENMIRRLTNGSRTVVARGAIAGDVHMIEDRGSKRCGGMAEMTVLCSWYMVCRRILTRSVLTVVTTVAGVGNALMIKHTRGKTGGVMTHPAIPSSGNMID